MKNLEGTAMPFDPAAGVPGLPGWQAVPAPGHTPGHVAFFRPTDRVLITGDAVLTVNVNSVRDLLSGRHAPAAPPYVSTWKWPDAKRSVAVLAGLNPSVLACGHGRPIAGPAASASLTALAGRLCQPASPTVSRPGTVGTRARTIRTAPPGGSGRRSARASCTATARERAMRVPGDDLVPDPVVQTTRAVTIAVPPDQVWPWLVQTGQGRAGFYSDSKLWDRCVDWHYRLLSRGQRGEIPSGYHVAADDRIVAAWQNPRPGDIISDGPPGTACYVVRQAEPGRSFVLFTDSHLRYLVPARLRNDPRLGITGEISDSFFLTEPEPGTTRLIRRMRLTCAPWPFRLYAVPIVLVWGEVITARNLLRGVKRRAEANAHVEPGRTAR